MCGRFALAVDTTTLQEDFPWVTWPDDLGSSFNIAPSQQVAVVANTGENRLETMRWGLIPSWAKEASIGDKLINARAETLAEKPSFRTAYRRRRCLILTSGYFEWMADPTGGAKIPVFIRLTQKRHFAFAGLWESWKGPDLEQPIRSCTIITCEPNDFLRRIHHRMPVILPEAAYQRWLDPAERTSAELDDLLVPYPGEYFQVFPVSRQVNNPRNNDAALIEPTGSLF